jgi:hypothetical protein
MLFFPKTRRMLFFVERVELPKHYSPRWPRNLLAPLPNPILLLTTSAYSLGVSPEMYTELMMRGLLSGFRLNPTKYSSQVKEPLFVSRVSIIIYVGISTPRVESSTHTQK